MEDKEGKNLLQRENVKKGLTNKQTNKSRHPGSKAANWNRTKEISSVLNFLPNFALSPPC